VDKEWDREQRIREIAYFKWESEMWPEGRALDNWLAAEREVNAMAVNLQVDQNLISTG
jgi:hypothetical protein